MLAGERAQIPVSESDVEAEKGWKDHHRYHEEDGGQDEQCSLSAVPADHHLPDTKRHTPSDERKEHRLPVFEPEARCPTLVQRFDEDQHHQHGGSGSDEPSPEATATIGNGRRDGLVALYARQRRGVLHQYSTLSRAGRRFP